MRYAWIVCNALGAALLLNGGCGVSGEVTRNTPGLSDADVGTSTDQQVVIPVSANVDAAATADIDSIVDDFFADDAPRDTIIGPDEFANFLAFLSDAFVAELFRGTPSIGGAESSIPRLERICVQQGTPEFICRQRYGN